MRTGPKGSSAFTAEGFHAFLSCAPKNFPTLCVPPEAMVPKVLINPQFSFGEMSKTAIDMKEHLDDICKKELSKISKTGLQATFGPPGNLRSPVIVSSSQFTKPPSTYCCQEMETNDSKVEGGRRLRFRCSCI